MSTEAERAEQAACGSMGEIGALFARRGDRYLARGGVRHRTQPNFLEPSTLVAACGISTSEAVWRGTGTQDEYERLARIPRCSNCLKAEGARSVPAFAAPSPQAEPFPPLRRSGPQS